MVFAGCVASNARRYGCAGCFRTNRPHVQTKEPSLCPDDWDFWDSQIKKVLDWLPLEPDAQGLGSGNVGKLD